MRVVAIVTKEMGIKNYDNDRLKEVILAYIRKRAILATVNIGEETNHYFKQQSSNTLFPASTLDIAIEVDLPTSTVYDLLEKLRRSKKIKSRLFQWFTRKIRLYIPYDMSWPEYLFFQCKNCENWNRFTRQCTFLLELKLHNFQPDIERLKKKIHPKLTACKFRIQRNTRALHTYPTLQLFAEKSGTKSLWWDTIERDDHYLFSPTIPFQGYRCLFCHKPMRQFGWGALPLIGSAIIACDHCSSFYKLIYDRKSETYGVIASEEQFHEYKRNFKLVTGKDPEPNYKSERYGISLQNFDPEEDLIMDVDTLSTVNIFGFFSQIDYLVVRDEDKYHITKVKLRGKHPRLDVLLISKPLTSVKPTKQQIGAAGQLRNTAVTSFDYAENLLWSRNYSLEELRDFGDKRRIREASEEITKKISFVQNKRRNNKPLTSEEWNRLDAKAANEVWGIIKPIMEENGFEMPNRFRARHLEEVSLKPYGLYTSYSSGNTILNGAFKKISDKY